ncbi:MAG TPA: hypothetical protein VF950_26200 [Planctomycetota bacterium]
MALDVKLAFQRTDLLYQEDSAFTLTLTNAGADPLKVTDPTRVDTTLAIKVIHVKSGVERLYSHPREGKQPAPRELPLASKKSLTATLSLQWIAYLSPGEYDVSAVYPYNGGALTAESAPVRIKIAPTTPRNFVLDSVQLDAPVGFWVDLGQDPPQIVRTRFDIQLGGQVRQLLRVAKGGLRTLPVPSRSPNGVWVDGHWAGWLEGGELHVAHVDPELGTSASQKLALPAGDATIVHPLYTDPPAKPGVRPGGALLLKLSTPGRDGFRLVPVTLASDRVTAGTALDLPGPAPSWIASFAASDKRRVVLYAQEKGGQVALSTVPWTGGPPRELGTFKGELAGAAVTAAIDADLLRGTLITRLGLAEHGALERSDFELGPKGEFTPKPMGRIPAPGDDHFTEALPRVSRSGAVAALLRDQKGQRHLYDGTAATLLPDPYKTSPYPLDVAFKGEDQPVLLAAFKDAGFRIVLPNGQPVPSAHH